jgi:phosphoribosylaminoimidazolecarboxamide formyltransferase / IMP cyclohydrolase
MPLKPIRRALISVSDKTGLIDFAKYLSKQKVEILSTGGTLKVMKDAGVPAKAVEEFTGFPEMLDGRVKTLHPKIHGGLLYRRDKKSHEKEAKAHGIEPIDLVVVNLYPFEKVTSDPSVDLETAIENIDIGGPSMLRSAAKNHDAVAVVCDPADYTEVMRQMEENKGAVSEDFRRVLAVKVYERTAAYDATISSFLGPKLRKSQETAASSLPQTFNIQLKKAADLRYGENPHQAAAYYVESGKQPGYKQLHGKELSFNNLLDMDATLEVIREFEAPAACVIKHNNPCGVAEDKNLELALEKAIECDSMSAFGGIIGINRPCDLATAQMAFDKLRFFEVFVAPSFEPKALALLQTRPNLRVMQTDVNRISNAVDFKLLGSGGALLQNKDLPLRQRMSEIKKNLKWVTKTKLSDSELEDLIFAFKCVKVVKSNAIVITQGRQTVGIGAGQMSRIDSVEIACRKAGYRTEGGLLASDAFFPMPDSVEAAHERKIRAIIQPGGSLRDGDVIVACDKFGIAMAVIGERHFKH